MLFQLVVDNFKKNIFFGYSHFFLYLTKLINHEPVRQLLFSKLKFDSTAILSNISQFQIESILETQKLDEVVIRKMIEQKLIFSNYHFLKLIQFQNLSDSFLEEYHTTINWSWVSKYQVLGEDTIRKFKNSLNWEFISSKQLLSIDFILEFNDYIDWFTIMKNPFLKLDFITRCQQYLDWNSVSLHMTMNTPLLKKYQDKLNWTIISSERVLHEDIILEFEDEINFALLLENEKQKKVHKYYSKKIIDIVQPHFDSYIVYHKKASLIQETWREFIKDNFLFSPKVRK